MPQLRASVVAVSVASSWRTPCHELATQRGRSEVGVAAGALVVAAVDGDALARRRPSPITRHPSGSGVPAGKVATSAWSSPPQRMNRIGSAPSAAPTACSGSAISKAVAADVDGDPARRRRCGRRRRAARRRRRSSRSRRPPAACGAGGVGRLRAAVGVDQHARRAEPAAEHRQAAPRPSPAGRRSRPRRRDARRTVVPACPSTTPSAVTATITWSAPVRSPPTTEAPTSRASAAMPVGQAERPLHREVRGRGQRDRQRGRAAAHRVDVGEVGGGHPVPDVLGVGPVAAEVPALDEHVGGDHHPPVRDGDHRGVVTRARGAPAHLGGTARRARRSARTRRGRRGSAGGKSWAPFKPMQGTMFRQGLATR